MRLRNQNSTRYLVMCTAIISSVIGCALPQPAEPVATIWGKLGIPQAMSLMGDQLINPTGDFPKAECKPPLKKIADLANLESDVPAIKAAAKIKQAEDAAKQKIKAVKYLASIGCGCYDEADEITDALIAALDDCTEQVRYATVKALYDRAKKQKKDGNCSRCGDSCCNEKLVKKLADVAYGVDDEMCKLEPSERVRRMAEKTLQICCPQQCQTYCNQQMQYDAVVPTEPYELAPPAEPGIYLEGPEREGGFEGEEDTKGKGFEGDDGAVSATEESVFAPGQASIRQVAVRNESARPAKTIAAQGRVTDVQPANGTATVSTDADIQLAVGSVVVISHRYQLGRVSTIGQAEVVQSRGGEAVIRPLGLLSIQRIRVNDSAVLFQ
jgi:hypothetical protein